LGLLVSAFCLRAKGRAEKMEGRRSARRRQLKKLIFSGSGYLSPGKAIVLLRFGTSP